MEIQYALIIGSLVWIIYSLRDIKKYFIRNNELLNEVRIELMRISGNEMPKTYDKKAYEEWKAKNP
jgi:hypothetical protein